MAFDEVVSNLATMLTIAMRTLKSVSFCIWLAKLGGKFFFFLRRALGHFLGLFLHGSDALYGNRAPFFQLRGLIFAEWPRAAKPLGAAGQCTAQGKSSRR